MKNNRLTNEDILKLRMACDRIRKLASMENASFSTNEDKDKQVKEDVKHYMEWFKCVANSVDRLLDGENVEYYCFR